jgi:bacillithiol biosynthesis cysteine-adding enzyme BshC
MAATAKPLARDVFARELAWPGRTTSLAAAAGDDLVALGYHAQVAAREDNVALFHLDGRRQPIRRQGDQFMVGDTSRATDTLLREIDRNPGVFSPNVLLRPLVQDTLFPTVAYVAGPSELAYLAQLGTVYEHFGLPMPLVVARASITLLDSAAARFMNRHEVALESLERQDAAALNDLLAAELPAGVEESFQQAKRAVEERMEAVIEAVPAIDPTLEGAARSALGRMRHDLDTLHGKLLQAAKRRDETLRRQFHRTRAQAFPGGHPQERSIGWVYLLNRYGPALVERLLAELPLDAGRHWMLTI